MLGVTVLIEGTNRGASTTFEGTYAIKADNENQNIQAAIDLPRLASFFNCWNLWFNYWWFKLCIFTLDRYNDSLVTKTYIAKLENEDKSSFVSNNLKNGKLIADIKLLGDYMIKVDSIPPSINLIDIEDMNLNESFGIT